MKIIKLAGRKAASWGVMIAMLAFASAVMAQNVGGILLPSAARTAATVVSATQTNVSGNSVHVILDVTAYTSGNLTLTVQGRDPASGKFYTLLAGAAVSSISTNVYKVGKALPVTGNVSANDILPTAWRVSIAGAATPVATWSVGYMVVQ